MSPGRCYKHNIKKFDSLSHVANQKDEVKQLVYPNITTLIYAVSALNSNIPYTLANFNSLLLLLFIVFVVVLKDNNNEIMSS